MVNLTEAKGHCLLLAPGTGIWEEQAKQARSQGVDLEVVNFGDGKLPSFGFGKESFDMIFAAAGSSRYDEIYPAILEALKAGGTLLLREAVGEAPLRSPADLTMSLTFAGFMEATGTPLPADRVMEMRTKKPSWGVGAAQKLTFGKKKQPTPAAAAAPSAGKTWKFMSDDMDDDTALIDEDDLLADDIVETKPVDCAPTGKPGKKRACANCSCG